MSNCFNGKHGPLIIAEIGGNHEGNFDYARRLANLAIESDVDFIKFQLYTGDTLVSPVEGQQRNQHFKKFELSKEQHIELAQICINAGKKYMASVWNPDFIEWIDPYISIYKIGSGDMTAYPHLRKFALTGKPMIISTGLATLEEVLATVRFVQSVNPIYRSADYLALLQCTSMYPISFGDTNLAVMQIFREHTGLTVGYSDHTEGSKAMEIAVAMGAQILEFHFTDDREGKTFRDHKVSLTKEEVWKLLANIREVQTLLGNGEKKPVQTEIDNGHVISFRRAIYAIKDLEAGTTLCEEDLTTLRPNHGIDARDWEKVIGKRLNKRIRAYERLDWNIIS